MKKIFLLCLAIFTLTISAYAEEAEVKTPLYPEGFSEQKSTPDVTKMEEMKGVDWGPYMRELERRIKRNWNPPKGKESKIVIAMFKVNRDGRLISIKITKSSGLADYDLAAKKAIEISAPFKKFPKECNRYYVDIEFTFDYNVIDAKRNQNTGVILDNYIERRKNFTNQE